MQSVLVRPIQRRLTDHSRPILYHGFAGGASSQLIDFSRDSTVNGWTLDANGDPVLTEFAIDAPAFVVDPATGRRLGYRAFEGFTNSLLWNRDLSNDYWSGSNATIAQDAVGLDGVANTAWTITDDDENGSKRVRPDPPSIADDSETHSVTLYCLKDEDETRFPRSILIFFGGSTTLRHDVYWNTKTGEKYDVPGNNDGVTEIQDAGDWWRVVVSLANNASGNTNVQWDVRPADNTEIDGSGTTTTGSIVMDHPAVYLNSEIAGPPIETQAEPVSTAPDNATEVLPESVRTKGTWNINARTAFGPEDQVLGQLDDGTDNSVVRVTRRRDRQIECFVGDKAPATVPDEAGTNDGVNEGAVPTVVDGRGGLEFDGDGNHITANTVEAVDKDKDYTFEAWVFCNDVAHDRGNCIFQNSYSLDHRNGMNIDVGIIRFGYYDGSFTAASEYLPEGQWVHVAGVNLSGALSLYLDGETASRADSGYFHHSSGLYLGANTLDTETFIGSLSDVRIWNYARTQSEIQADMNTRLTGNETGLVAYYPMDNFMEAGFELGEAADDTDINVTVQYANGEYAGQLDSNVVQTADSGELPTVNTKRVGCGAESGVEWNSTIYWDTISINQEGMGND